MMADETTLRVSGFKPGGWCGGCGRKLTADGRCPNCDAWWASPLIRVGGPLVLATIALLAVGIGWLGSREQLAASEGRLLPQAIGYVSPANGAAFMAGGPSFAGERRTPPMDASVVWPLETRRARVSRPRPRPIRMAEQVRLRVLSDQIQAIIDADDDAREKARVGQGGVAVKRPLSLPAHFPGAIDEGGDVPFPGASPAPPDFPGVPGSSLPYLNPSGGFAPGAAAPVEASHVP